MNKDKPYLCLFGDVMFPHIKSDLIIIQSLYDSLLVKYVFGIYFFNILIYPLGVDCVEWTKYTLEACNEEQMSHIEGFKKVKNI